MQDLKEAFQLFRRAVALTSIDDPGTAAGLDHLRNKFNLRYEHTGKREDLEEAIQLSHRAVELTPPNHADLAQRLYDFGAMFGWPYGRTGKMKDLEKAFQGIRFFVDLNDFEALLDDRIDTFLTITGSSQDAFANSAACYVRWHWGQRGIDILNWLPKFLLAARSSNPTHPLLVYGEDDDTETTCIELQGSLDNQSSTPLPKRDVVIRVRWIEGSIRNYFILVAAVASQLAWIVAAFKEPPEDNILFSSAKIEGPLTHFPNDEDNSSIFRIKCEDAQDVGPKNKKDSTCWHKLFAGLTVAVGFRIPERPRGMRGLELPFSVMATFAHCNYSVEYKGGYVLKGWYNALFPVRIKWGKGASMPPSAVQWHLFTTERYRLHMEEAKMTPPRLRPVRTKLSDGEFFEATAQCKRHFLGSYEDSRFSICTNASRADKINDRLKQMRLGRRVEWTRGINFSAGGGPPGASFGVTTSIRFRTLQENLRRIRGTVIEVTKAISTILFKVQTRIAWMLFQLCVVIYLIHARIKKRFQNACQISRFS